MLHLIKRIWNYHRYPYYLLGMAKISMSFARAATMSALRKIDETEPLTWEFSGFSQNGEDGILDVLIQKLKNPTRYSIEIGANDGIENCTAWLAFARKYTVLMIDGDRRLSARCKYLLDRFCYHTTLCLFADRDNIDEIKKHALHMDPDVFSLDIDGVDYYVTKAFLDAGFHPKIIVVEYNSSFGPDKSMTIEYRKDIYNERARGEHPMYYWGVSIAGWKTLFAKYGYRFLTVDSNGVNGFFYDPKEFDENFVKNLKPGLPYRQNASTFWYSKTTWQNEFKEIEHTPLVEIK